MFTYSLIYLIYFLNICLFKTPSKINLKPNRNSGKKWTAPKKMRQRCLPATRLSPFPANYAHIDFHRLESNSLEIGPSATGETPKPQARTLDRAQAKGSGPQTAKCKLRVLVLVHVLDSLRFDGRKGNDNGGAVPTLSQKKAVSLTDNWKGYWRRWRRRWRRRRVFTSWTQDAGLGHIWSDRRANAARQADDVGSAPASVQMATK